MNINEITSNFLNTEKAFISELLSEVNTLFEVYDHDFLSKLNTFDDGNYRKKVSRGGLTKDRGCFGPNMISDLFITNATKGRMLNEKTNIKYDYEYYFDEKNNLVRIVKFPGTAYTKNEYIIYKDNYSFGISYDSHKRQQTITFCKYIEEKLVILFKGDLSQNNENENRFISGCQFDIYSYENDQIKEAIHINLFLEPLIFTDYTVRLIPIKEALETDKFYVIMDSYVFHCDSDGNILNYSKTEYEGFNPTRKYPNIIPWFNKKNNSNGQISKIGIKSKDCEKTLCSIISENGYNPKLPDANIAYESFEKFSNTKVICDEEDIFLEIIISDYNFNNKKKYVKYDEEFLKICLTRQYVIKSKTGSDHIEQTNLEISYKIDEQLKKHEYIQIWANEFKNNVVFFEEIQKNSEFINLLSNYSPVSITIYHSKVD